LGAETDPSARGTGASAELSSLEDQVVRAVFDLQPTFAVFLGLHEYDGRLPDLSPAGTDRWVERARSLLGRLERFPAADLPIPRRFDRTLLSLLLESALFDLEETHDYDRNPMIYVGQISLTPYLVRAYKPADERVRAMTEILEAASGSNPPSQSPSSGSRSRSAADCRRILPRPRSSPRAPPRIWGSPSKRSAGRPRRR
jgi:hypothetical protein